MYEYTSLRTSGRRAKWSLSELQSFTQTQPSILNFSNSSGGGNSTSFTWQSTDPSACFDGDWNGMMGCHSSGEHLSAHIRAAHSQVFWLKPIDALAMSGAEPTLYSMPPLGQLS